MRINYAAIIAFLLALVLVKLMWSPLLNLYGMGVMAGQYNAIFANLEGRIQKLERVAISLQQPTPEVKNAAAGSKSN